MRTLKNNLALVTGASHGIGKAVAIGLARAGCDVILIARRKEELDEVAKRIRGVGQRAFVYAIDLGKPDSIKTTLDAISQQFKKLDILWNGAFGWVDGPLEAIDAERIGAFLDSSIRGTILLTQGLLCLLLRADHPCIMNVCADWEFPPNTGLSVFIAAKRAIAGFGIALTKEKPGRLRVTNLYPADIASVGFDIDDDPAVVFAQHGDSKIPLKEFVELIVFIASLEHTIIHQIDIKPRHQEIAMTFLS